MHAPILLRCWIRDGHFNCNLISLTIPLLKEITISYFAIYSYSYIPLETCKEGYISLLIKSSKSQSLQSPKPILNAEKIPVQCWLVAGFQEPYACGQRNLCIKAFALTCICCIRSGISSIAAFYQYSYLHSSDFSWLREAGVYKCGSI